MSCRFSTILCCSFILSVCSKYRNSNISEILLLFLLPPHFYYVPSILLMVKLRLGIVQLHNYKITDEAECRFVPTKDFYLDKLNTILQLRWV